LQNSGGNFKGHKKKKSGANGTDLVRGGRLGEKNHLCPKKRGELTWLIVS